MMLHKYFTPSRYIARARQKIALSRYDLKSVQHAERAKFAAAGLDVDAGRERLNQLLAQMSGRPFDHVTGSDSVHWLLFSCFSLTPRRDQIQRILEIGTFRGKTTAILKHLFPSSEIVTCDLPDNDPILTNTYRRETAEALDEYVATRDARVSQPGIRFVPRNSFFLPEVAPGPYDLIWMDGGHLYPEVAWDMCNAWHMCRPGGIVMCDDVYRHPKGGDGVYGSPDAQEVINYLALRQSFRTDYFLKRENPAFAADPLIRKHVAVLYKPDLQQ